MKTRLAIAILSLTALFLLSQNIGVTNASFVDTETSDDNRHAAWVSEQWTQTTDGDFGAGAASNVEIGSGSVVLDIIPNLSLDSSDNTEMDTGTSNAQLVKTLLITKNGSAYNEIRIDTNLKTVGGTSVTGSIHLNNTEIFSHTTTSSSYVSFSDTFDFSGYADGSYTLKLYLTASGGYGYNSLFEVYTTNPTQEAKDDNEVTQTGNIDFVLKKTLNFTRSGSAYNNLRFDTNLRATGNSAYLEIYINNVYISALDHSTDSSSYVSFSDTFDFSGYADGAYTVDLYLKIGNKNQTAYNSLFEIWLTDPTLVASDNNEYSVSGTLLWQLMKVLYITKYGDSYNELRIDSDLKSTGALAESDIRIDDVSKATHSTNSTTYLDYSDTIDTLYLSEGSHTIKLYLKTSNKNKPAFNTIFEIYRTHTYAASGTLASQVFDTAVAADRWDALFWDESLPSGTDITFEVRASDSSFLTTADTPSWTTVGSNSPVTAGLAEGRYKQWRASLTPDSAQASTPVLQEVRVYYYGN